MDELTGYARLEFSGSPTELTVRAQGNYRVIRGFRHINSALVQLLHLGPGMVSGDRYRLEVEVAPGATGVVVNPAAQLILTSAGEAAHSQVEIQVHSGGNLVFLPSPTLAYPGARLEQNTRIELEHGARLAWLEVYRTTGFHELSLRTTAKVDGRPLLREGLELGRASGTGILDGNNALGSALIYPGSAPNIHWQQGYLTTLPAGGLYGRGLGPEPGTLVPKLLGLILENSASWDWIPPEFFRFAPALSQYTSLTVGPNPSEGVKQTLKP